MSYNLSRRRLGQLAGAALALGVLPRVARADAAAAGQWSPVYAWPHVGIHLTILPDRRILSFQDHGGPLKRPSTDNTLADVVILPDDGAPGSTTPVPNEVSGLFCSGHTHLPDGRLLVVGGQDGGYYSGLSEATIFDPATGRWSRPPGSAMARPRWYGTAVTLANGHILAIGGTMSGKGTANRVPEIWDGARWRRLSGATHPAGSYPPVFQCPDGRVFRATGDSAFLSITGNGRWTAGPRRRVKDRATGPTAMYRPGKVIAIGGGSTALASAEIVDVTSARARWALTQPMRFRRRHANATLLPDGTVLVTGGTSIGGNKPEGAVRVAELWNPDTGRWTELAPMATVRTYHSTALLLPDGRVLVAGGGRSASAINHPDAEVFSPPYLFRGPRPTIDTAPERVAYGEAFTVVTPGAAAAAAVSLVKLGTVTHSLNFGQCFVPATFVRNAADLTVTAPASGNVAPPGHYLMFILNGSGVPSIARTIRLG